MFTLNGFKKTVLALSVTTIFVCSVLPCSALAKAKPSYMDDLKQLTQKGIISVNEFSPNKNVKVSSFLKMAVMTFTYKHGEDFNVVARDLEFVKKGELPSTSATIKKGEVARICIRALGLDKSSYKSTSDYLNAAKKLGIIQGPLGKHAEKENVTYSQMINILKNAKKIQYSNINNKGVEKIPTETFFKNPMTVGYSMSADGKYLSYVAPWENRLNVFVVPASGGEPKRITSSKDRDIAGYAWKDDTIIYLKDNGGDENYHIFTTSLDGKTEDVDLTPYPGVMAYYVDMLKGTKNEILIAMNKKDPKLFDIYKLNISTGVTVMVAQNPGNISGWLTDNDGKLRLAGISDGIESTILYREKEEDEFKPLLTTKNSESFSPIMFSKDNKSLYATSNIGRDTAAIVKMDLKTLSQQVVYERKDVDVSNLIANPSTKEILAVMYVKDKGEIEYLNNDYKALIARASETIGKGLSISVNDISEDMTKFIMSSGSDKDPGAYYYYDATSNKSTKLGDFSPWIDASKMSEMKPVSYKSSDGLTIHGYLTLPANKVPSNLPVIVNPHGGPWARDVWGYNPEVQFLANRGYAVLQVNFRGSTGYGKKFVDAGNKQWGLKMQDDITDGVKWLIKQGIANPKKVGIYGGSYGGYATLAGITFTPDLYAAAVDYVGVSNIFTLLDSIPPYWESQRKMFYERVGDPVKDKELLTKVSPVFHADKIKTPLFVAQGANDPRVKKAESDQIVEALKKRGVNVQYMVKENEGHGFANEENRFDFYKAMDEFFAKYLK